MTNKLTYKSSGVDIDAGNALVDRIKSVCDKTRRSEVISQLGGFSGYFSLTNSGVKNPVLVASTDGVGTKLKIALDMKKFDGLGQDLVAMCVNDLICCGAEPLFFLDYYAAGKLDVDEAAEVITSIAEALKAINCTLLGGETAEMPGLYQKGDFDIAGFAVGIVDKEKIIEGTSVGNGNVVIGLESSGFHSNGYSLVRSIIKERNLDLNKVYPISLKPLGLELLTPTRVYVNPVLHLLRNYQILAMAHITGGGIVENLPRVMSKKCKAIIDTTKFEVPALFRFFQEQGNVPEEEMWRVFNMGIGYIIIAKPGDADGIVQQLSGMKFKAHIIGEIVEKKTGDEAEVEIV
jgi:phosphoribosylformylglycinamidine cyclo-ligase